MLHKIIHLNLGSKGGCKPKKILNLGPQNGVKQKIGLVALMWSVVGLGICAGGTTHSTKNTKNAGNTRSTRKHRNKISKFLEHIRPEIWEISE